MSRVVVALIAVALFAFASCIERTEPELREMYDQWAKKYNRYYTMGSIRNVKYEAFKQNIKQIDEHNSKKDKTYELGVNEYADMTWSEFQTHFRLNEPQHCSATGAKPFISNSEPPKAVDWRTKNAVSAVKSQGRCGSCWTFSTTGALESHAFLKTGKMHDLSEQQLVDCAGDFDNHGCSGGLPSHAFEYVHYAGGIQNETTYNYKAVDGKCVFNKDLVVVKAQGSHNITVGDEDSMVKAIAEVGPVSIAYQVASDFRFYKKGVYNSVVCKSGPLDVNHAVLAVGYDVTAEGLPYWIVKNSWGTSFGLDGYFHIVRGKNMCGLAVCSSYPLLE